MDFWDYLRSIHIEEETISSMQKENVDINIIAVMSEDELGWFFKSIDDRILVKNYARTHTENYKRKHMMIKNVRKKLQDMRSKRLDKTQSGSTKRLKRENNSTKSTRQIYLGWKNQEKGKTILVFEKKGGGTFLLSLPKELKKSDILEIATKKFFPDGKSSKGSAQCYTFDIIDNLNNPIDEDISIAEMIEKKAPKYVRLYLKSVLKEGNCDMVADEKQSSATTFDNHNSGDNEKEFKNWNGECSKEPEPIMKFSCEDEADNGSSAVIIEEVPTVETFNVYVEYADIKISRYSGNYSSCRKNKLDIFTELQCQNESEVRSWEEFDPIDYEYPIVSIKLGEKYILDIEICADGKKKHHFPSNTDLYEHKRLYDIDQLNGLDCGRLGMGTIFACDDACNTIYSWYLEDELYKEGRNLFWISTTKPGNYRCEVICNRVQNLHFIEVQPVPVIEKGDLQISDKILGAGAQGMIREGKWLGTKVAIKSFRTGKLSETDLREVNLLSQIRHPHIIQIMAICLEQRQTHIILELVQGHNLGDIIFDDEIRSKYNLDLTRKYDIIRQICLAVSYLHLQKNPIIHQDIKPDNILVNENLLVKLCDLGLAKLKNMATVFQTTVGSIKGTVIYLAPEVLLRQEVASTASDIWSLASTVVEILTENDVWDNLGSEVLKNLAKKMNMTEKPCYTSIVQSDLTGLLDKCFSYVPADRPDITELLDFFSPQEE